MADEKLRQKRMIGSLSTLSMIASQNSNSNPRLSLLLLHGLLPFDRVRIGPTSRPASPSQCRYPKLSLEATCGHRSLVRMLISEVSVRCTGHLLAISSSRERCSAVKGPSNCTSRSILSSIPSFISHSEQSAAYIFECRSQTVTRSNGQFFCRAYMPTVIDVQEPRAASKKS